MKKFRIYNVQFTIKIFVFLFTFYILHSTFTQHVIAAESTPSADIKEKLEELKKGIASRAAKLKQEVSSKLKDKAYSGTVKSKSTTSITLATKNGPKIVNINQDTEFISQIKNKKYSQTQVAEEDYIASLGDVDETGVLTARRIILLPTPSKEVKTFLWGQIISLSDKLVTLKDKTGKNIAVSLKNPDAVKVSDFVILTGNMTKNEIFEAEYLYIIPQGGILKPKKTATPASGPATPTQTPKASSPSASPKSSAKPSSR